MSTPILNTHPEIKGMLEKLIADRLERMVVDEETVAEVVHEIVELRQCLAFVTGVEPVTGTTQPTNVEPTPEEINKIVELVKIKMARPVANTKAEPYVHTPRRQKMQKIGC